MENHESFEDSETVTSEYSLGSFEKKNIIIDTRKQKTRIVKLRQFYKVWFKCRDKINRSYELIIMSLKSYATILFFIATVIMVLLVALFIVFSILNSEILINVLEPIRFAGSIYFAFYIAQNVKTVIMRTYSQRILRRPLSFSILRFILQYSCVIEFTLFNICVSYFIRCMSETFILQNGEFVTDRSKLFSNCCVFIIMLLAFITSNDPENVVFMKVTLQYVFIVILTERTTIHGDSLASITMIGSDLIHFLFSEVVNFSVTFMGTALFKVPISLYLLEALIFGTFSTLTNFCFIYDLLGSQNEKGEYYIPCNIAIVIIVIFAYFFNPTLALFISLPMLPCLHDNEFHFVFCAFLTSPISFESFVFYRSIPKHLIFKKTLIMMPTLWMMCSLTAPRQKGTADSFHLAFPFDARRLQTQHSGFRTMIIFSKKLVPTLLAVELVTVGLYSFAVPLFQFLLASVSGLDYFLFDMSLILGVAIFPMVYCVTLPRTDILMVSCMCY